MGNCQASDAVAAVVELPCGKVDKIYWRLTARQLMLQNPGHYVGVYAASPSSSQRLRPHQGKPKLKLLPPAAVLNAGKCYRLVTYEEVIGDLTQGRGNIKIPRDAIKLSSAVSKVNPEAATAAAVSNQQDEDAEAKPPYPPSPRPGQWRPSLQSISELGAEMR